MKQSILFLIALFVFASCEQEQRKSGNADTVITGKSNPVPDSVLNYTDAAGLRQGHWIITGSMKHDPQYAPDAKAEEGKYLNGKKEGVWRTYDPNGNLKSLEHFVNDQRRDQ